MDADIPMDDAALVEAHGEPPPTDSEQLPTADVVKKWTEAELLSFKQLRDILRNDENRKTFEKAQISGRAFLLRGDDECYWMDRCHLPPGPSAMLADLAQRIKNMGKEKSRGNAFHLASDEPANTFTVQSPPSSSIVQREGKRTAEEAERIAEKAARTEERERDEIIKSENSRAACDPKSIAN